MITFGLGEENDYYARNVVAHGRDAPLLRPDEEGRGEGGHRHPPAGAAQCPQRYRRRGGGAGDGGHAPGAGGGDAPLCGAGRRFEVLGERQGVTVADDYAHHPAEIAATLRAAKELPFARVWAVFQPFTYSRPRC